MQKEVVTERLHEKIAAGKVQVSQSKAEREAAGMMQVGGIFSKKQVANFLIDKVGKPFASAYIRHLLRYNRD